MQVDKYLRRELRVKATQEEQLLWQELRGKKLGCKFRRQHHIGCFIADFYCPEAKLIIEIDGSPHKVNEQKRKDYSRDEYCDSMGIRTLRFWGNQVRRDMSMVLQLIKNRLPKK